MTRFPKWFLAAIFSSIMPAQQIVQVQPSALDIAATGVHLVALDDIGHTATVEAILGEDRPMVAPILPYGVLIVNSSLKNLTTVSVSFMGREGGPDGNKRRITITASEFSPIPPNGSLLYTPISLVNRYLVLSPDKRKDLIGGTSTAAIGGVTSGDLPSFIKQRMIVLPIFGGGPKDFIASLEGVAFDDDSFVGSQMVLKYLKSSMPKSQK